MKNVNVFSGNLFEIAAAQLGSALQWINIARVNQISDPFITTPQEVNIPAFSQSFEDGIGPQ